MSYTNLLTIVILFAGAIFFFILIWRVLVSRQIAERSIQPNSLEAIADARLDSDEFAASPVSEQIEEMVKEKLAALPDLNEVRLDFASSADGSLHVWIDDVRYEMIESVPDERIRKAIEAAVVEFNR